MIINIKSTRLMTNQWSILKPRTGNITRIQNNDRKWYWIYICDVIEKQKWWSHLNNRNMNKSGGEDLLMNGFSFVEGTIFLVILPRCSIMYIMYFKVCFSHGWFDGIWYPCTRKCFSKVQGNNVITCPPDFLINIIGICHLCWNYNNFLILIQPVRKWSELLQNLYKAFILWSKCNTRICLFFMCWCHILPPYITMLIIV